VIPFPSARPARPALVVGGYGYRNAGDEAILAGLIQLLGRDSLTVVSRMPAETAAQHGVRSVSVSGAIRELARHRSVIIGGGGLFGRDMGLVGRLLPPFGLLSSLGGRDVALIGVGIDEDMPALAARLTYRLARRASTVIVRDAESVEVLAARGIGATLWPDLSTFAPSAGRKAGVAALRASGLDPARRPVVGLCLTAVDASLVEPVMAAVFGAVDSLPELDFCLIPMSRHPFVAAHNDELLARRLVERRPRLRILRGADETGTLLGVFEALRGVVGMRFHSLLFAERAGIPIVAIPYAEKCRRWLRDHDMEATEPTAAALVAAMSPLVEAKSA
jgi:polysaccharide pyruvyl transferase WcaK-like protein